MEQEHFNSPEKGEKITLSFDQVANLQLILDSMSSGQKMMEDKLAKAQKNGVVSIPTELAPELDAFANDKDNIMGEFDRLRKLINSIEIE